MTLGRAIRESGARSSHSGETEILEAVVVRQERTEAGAEPNMSLLSAIRAIRRRVPLIIAGTAVLSIIGIAITLLLPPRYRAETLLLIDPRREQVTNVQEVVSALPADQAALRSEIDVLKSSALIQRVAQAANLVDNPEFNPTIDPSVGFPWMLLFWLDPERQRELADHAKGFVERVVGRFMPKMNADAPAGPRDLVAVAAMEYGRHVTVTTDGKSLTIRLQVESRDPELAARLANIHAELYVTQQLKNRLLATDRAHSWLGERIEQLRKDVQRSDDAIQKYREENRLIKSGSGTTITMQQLAELNTQLTLAQAEKVQAESRLKRVHDLLRNKAGIDSVPEVLASQTIEKLTEQEAALRRLEADGMSRYANPNHPAIISARAQLRDLHQKIASEVGKIAASLQSSAEIAASRERNLQQAVQGLLKQAADASLAEMKLTQLEREADATRSLYQTFLSRMKETSFGPAPNLADARIVSPADVPIRPSSPRYLLFFVGSFAAALAASAGFAVFLEAKEDRLRSPTQCKGLVGVPGLGLVPQVGRWQGGRVVRIADRIMVGRDGVPRDAVRSVLELLLAASSRKRPFSVLVTSTVPNEGKTVFAIWLARLSAMAGYRVLLIDADLRRPTVAKALGLGSDTALSTQLTTRETIWSGLREDPVTGMHHIEAATQSDEIHGAASLRQLEGVLEESKNLYDLVFIDSAPVLAAPEVLSISQMTDGVIFAVRWGHTPYKQVRHAVNLVRSVSANLIGAVVTRADIRKHSTYAFGDVGDVYGRYGGYYRA